MEYTEVIMTPGSVSPHTLNLPDSLKTLLHLKNTIQMILFIVDLDVTIVELMIVVLINFISLLRLAGSHPVHKINI